MTCSTFHCDKKGVYPHVVYQGRLSVFIFTRTPYLVPYSIQLCSMSFYGCASFYSLQKADDDTMTDMLTDIWQRMPPVPLAHANKLPYLTYVIMAGAIILRISGVNLQQCGKRHVSIDVFILQYFTFAIKLAYQYSPWVWPAINSLNSAFNNDLSTRKRTLYLTLIILFLFFVGCICLTILLDFDGWNF